jgi:hypothetical protein
MIHEADIDITPPAPPTIGDCIYMKDYTYECFMVEYDPVEEEIVVRWRRQMPKPHAPMALQRVRDALRPNLNVAGATLIDERGRIE